MEKPEGMTNMQNIPATETDFDEVRAYGETDLEQRDNDKNKSSNENKKPVHEFVPEQARKTSAFSLYERRIY